jgi:hypothetical protein
MGICPYCKTIVTNVTLGEVNVDQQWRGIKYSCPSCQCILGVSIDPVALKNDIVAEILHAPSGPGLRYASDTKLVT